MASGGEVPDVVLSRGPAGWTFVLVTAQPWYMRGLLPARQIRDPVTELIVTRHDEATPLAIKGVTDQESGVAAFAEFGEVWGL